MSPNQRPWFCSSVRTTLILAAGMFALFIGDIRTVQGWDVGDYAKGLGKVGGVVTSKQPNVSGAPNQMPTYQSPAPAYSAPSVAAPPPATYYVPQSSQAPVALNPEVVNPQNFYHLQPPVDCGALWARFNRAIQNTGYGMQDLYESDALLRQHCGKQ